MSSHVFSRTPNRAVLTCDCGARVARPGFAPEPGTPSMGEHVASHVIEKKQAA